MLTRPIVGFLIQFPDYISSYVHVGYTAALAASGGIGIPIPIMEGKPKGDDYIGKVRYIVEHLGFSKTFGIDFELYRFDWFDDGLITNVDNGRDKELLSREVGDAHSSISNDIRQVLKKHFVVGDFVEIVADFHIHSWKDHYGEYNEEVWFEKEIHHRLTPEQVLRFCDIDISQDWAYPEPMTFSCHPCEDIHAEVYLLWKGFTEV